MVGGVLVAAALPPWGFWPLAFIGVMMFETALQKADTRAQRARWGWLFAAFWMFPGMAWMWFLSAPGYLVAIPLFAGFHAVAATVSPTGPWRAFGRPAAHTLAEALRFCFPFGGVPLASLAIGQAGGPFLGIAAVGGALVLTWFVFQVGFALAGPSPYVPALARKRGVNAKAEWHGVVAFSLAMLVWAFSPFAHGSEPTNVDGPAAVTTPRVAVVQGGGPQGTHAIHTDANLVFQRHLQATRTITPGSVDLVVWPENVIDVAQFEGSAELAQVAAEASRIGAPFAVGVTEDAADPNHFVNAQVVVTPDGKITSRYEKVRRVPFGEYMPLRGLLHALGAPTDLVPRDAVAGTGPAYLDLPNGSRLAVAISWEIFFGGRVNDGVSHGGQYVINPTNGSSYTWTILQSQQVASSRLRAVEQNRWVVQAAPTGFSAFISPSGEVIDRTSISEQKVITHTITAHVDSTTIYAHTGNIVWVIVFALLFAMSWLAPRGRGWVWGARPR
jgi:apolipoprotein N-acyltransferase